MRCTQLIGLPVLANVFIHENYMKSPEETCPTCGHTSGGKMYQEVYDDASNTGMFDDGPKLFKYRLEDGGMAFEKVQATPWASGPCIFLSLEVQDCEGGIVTEFKWSEEEMDAEL